jgi:gamma-glutamyltranspeptidase/glutathione hydrolase
MGTKYAITSGHYLATAAGSSVIEKGGNAIDAAACMAFCLAVLEPHLNSIGGEVPILIYSAEEKRTVAISGQGYAPRRATLGKFRELGISPIPGDGLLAAAVPSMASSWIEALKAYGDLRLSDVLKPAISLAEGGFPAYRGLIDTIEGSAERFSREWRTSARIFLPDGKVPREGQVLVQPDLARVLRALAEADSSASDRIDGFDKAHSVFYEGWVAQAIVDFTSHNKFRDASGKENGGLIELDDLADYRAREEESLKIDWGEVDVYKCSTWTQGPVLLQALRILQGFDIRKLGHNSVDYVHLLTEAMKLAFADRERYYGDPDFDDVPIARLLSREYAEGRRHLIDMGKASSGLTAGDANARAGTGVGDTTHLDAVDGKGNMVSATQSGAWIQSSPVVEGLGFPLGTRAQMFYLDERRPNRLEPRKRPRTTLTPSIALRAGRPYLAFGTPGGDTQDQINLQFFLNFVVFGMNLQEALDEPTFYSQHFPSSFYPRSAFPRRLIVENRLPKEVVDGLIERGHDVRLVGGWSNGRALAVHKADGVLMAGASPRMYTGYAMAW